MRGVGRRTHHKIEGFSATPFGSRREYHLRGKRYSAEAGLLGRDDGSLPSAYRSEEALDAGFRAAGASEDWRAGN